MTTITANHNLGIDLRQECEDLFSFLQYRPKYLEGSNSPPSPENPRRYLALAESTHLFAAHTGLQPYEIHRMGKTWDSVRHGIDADTIFTVTRTEGAPGGTVVLYQRPKRWENDYTQDNGKSAFTRETRVDPNFWPRGYNLREKLERILKAHVNPDMPDIEVARELYRFVTSNFKFGVPNEEFNGVRMSTDFNGIENVCKYYAYLYASLLNMAGIPARTISSRVRRESYFYRDFKDEVMFQYNIGNRKLVRVKTVDRFNPLKYVLHEGMGWDDRSQSPVWDVLLNQFGGMVIYKDEKEYGIVLPNLDELKLTKREPRSCHDWVEAQLGGKTFPFDPTWDLGYSEQDWRYFAGFRKRGQVYHAYQLDGIYAREV